VIIAWTVGFGSMIVLWSWRWRLLLKSYDIHYSLLKAIELYLIGMFAGFFLSNSLGAFIRGFYAKEDGYPVSEAMMTIFLDKTLEITSLLVFGVLGLFVFPSLLPQRWVIWAAIIGLICGGAAVIWIFRGRLGKWFSKKLDTRLNRHFPHIEGTPFSQLYKGLQAITLLSWVQLNLVSLAGRFLHYTSVYILARGLNIPLSFLSVVAIMSLVGIVVALPISLAGGLGTRDATLVGLFTILGQSSEAAISLSFLILVCSLGWIIIGMLLWLRHPLRWSEEEADTSLRNGNHLRFG
jgi:uncharacterized protein (TIRG00374 family)